MKPIAKWGASGLWNAFASNTPGKIIKYSVLICPRPGRRSCVRKPAENDRRWDLNDGAGLSQSVNIRLASIDDAQEIAKVHVATWRDAYKELLPIEYLANLDENARAEKWRKALLAGAPCVLVAVMNGMVAAWVAFGPSRDEDLDSRCAEIEAIYVASDFWSRGIGTALIHAACERLHAKGYCTVALWVLKDNAAACSFYSRRGFEPDGSAKVVEIGGALLTEVRVTREIAT
ncbi:GNAT family N-acetyltransferase [Paraburkholderia terrae]|uniref:GNAT family N-acetyltransferase n=1 Tax=Paraburkholderia terrae TaxID=311230 RepID=UPI0020BD61E1|nr:GNAT family N-acetyltransferase [Paraburkholderia terrae]